MPGIDLHTHSTASDGTDAPAELIAKAHALGLKAIALTDHDTTDGLEEAEAAARGFGLKFIRGCEISTRTDEGSMHVLGLWLPRNNPGLSVFLEKLRQIRIVRNEKILAKLANYGIHFTMPELEAQAKGVVGRPHFASLLLKKGYVSSLAEAFEVWLGENGKVYVHRENIPSTEDAVRILNEFGVATVLAHPLLRDHSDGWLENLVRKLKAEGLFGLEVWHSAHTPEKVNAVRELALKYDLAMSGGTDYHGSRKPQISLGSGSDGNVNISLNVLEVLEQKRSVMGFAAEA